MIKKKVNGNKRRWGSIDAISDFLTGFEVKIKL